jgi:poly-gamma-glutamate capsule biosynthesis protein CapA/YwtB (metallophosphatase superfamily)
VRRRWLIALVVLSLVGAVAIALDGGGSPREPGAAERAGPTTRAPVTSTTTRGRRGSGAPVRLLFAGDVHFEGALRGRLEADPGGMFATIAPVLGDADVTMVNLETAIATGGTPDDKEYTFRAPPIAFEALRVAGVDAVSMANNHGRDFGAVGLVETLAAKAGTSLVVLGIGADAAEAYRPWRTEVQGQRLAFFAANDVLDDWLIDAWSATETQGGLAMTKPGGVERLLAAIRAERPEADTVVVFLHWGAEGDTCPTARQQELAGQLVAAGADVIVGSHTHRVMTAGRLGDAFVDYGLGNFVFYNEAGESGVTGVLRVTVTGRDVDGYEWVPGRIRNGIPQWLGPEESAADLAGFAERQACAGLTP